jgi:hypothetical protein
MMAKTRQKFAIVLSPATAIRAASGRLIVA